MNFNIKEEADKFIHFIETCSDSELDKLLADAKFGSLKHMTPLVQRVLNDDLLNPRRKVGEDKGKPIYKSYYPEESFYEENGAVYCDFVNSEGKPMRYKYKYQWYDTSAFCEKYNIPLKERPITQPFEMLVTRTEFI